jgi:hypothetical protein
LSFISSCDQSAFVPLETLENSIYKPVKIGPGLLSQNFKTLFWLLLMNI